MSCCFRCWHLVDCTELFWVRMSSIGIIDTSKNTMEVCLTAYLYLLKTSPCSQVTLMNLWRHLSCSLSSFPWTTTSSVMPITPPQWVRIWSINHWKISCEQAKPPGEVDKSEPSPWWLEGHEHWWLIVKDYVQEGWGSIKHGEAGASSQFIGDLFHCRGFVVITSNSCIKILWVKTDCSFPFAFQE